MGSITPAVAEASLSISPVHISMKTEFFGKVGATCRDWQRSSHDRRCHESEKPKLELHSADDDGGMLLIEGLT